MLRRMRAALPSLWRRVIPTGAAVLVVAGLVMCLQACRFTGEAPAAAPPKYLVWRDGPTRGELRGDAGLLSTVLDAWKRRVGATGDDLHLLDHPTSDAHVVWAGRVHGKPAAVVVQQADVTPKELPGLDEGGKPAADIWGFVRVDGERAVVGTTALQFHSDFPIMDVLGGWLDPVVGPALLLDIGVPIQMSRHIDVSPSGQYMRATTPVVFGDDGMAVVDLEPGDGSRGLVVGSSRRPVTDIYQLPGSPLHGRGYEPSWTLPYPSDTTLLVPVAGTRPGPTGSGLNDALAQSAINALDGVQSSYSQSPWVVGGVLPDGTTIGATAFLIDGGLRLLVLDDDTYGDRGLVDPHAPLPIAVRLDRGRGWLVASPRAGLRFRVDGSPWVHSGHDAALLPDDATEVEVDVPGRGSVVVPLVA